MQIVLVALTIGVLMLVLIPVVLYFSQNDLAVNLKFWGIVMLLISLAVIYGA
jgi:hypothetical protein